MASAQSLADAHVVKQAVPAGLHFKFPGQGPVASAGQAPAPLQLAGWVSVEPEHCWVRQLAAAPG